MHTTEPASSSAPSLRVWTFPRELPPPENPLGGQWIWEKRKEEGGEEEEEEAEERADEVAGEQTDRDGRMERDEQQRRSRLRQRDDESASREDEV